MFLKVRISVRFAWGAKMLEQSNRALDPDSKKKYERIAMMKAKGYGQEVIGDAVALSAARINAIFEDARFQEILARVLAETVEQEIEQQSTAEQIETLAGRRVVEYLKSGRDPDFALKAWALAVKSPRRHINNKPLEPANAGAVVVLQLPTVFVRQRQENAAPAMVVDNVEVKKISNMMPINGVKEMLAPVSEFAEIVDMDETDMQRAFA